MIEGMPATLEVMPPALTGAPATALPPLANAPPSSLGGALSLLFEHALAKNRHETLNNSPAYARAAPPRRASVRAGEILLAQSSAFGG
jgi:hypothetical protein